MKKTLEDTTTKVLFSRDFIWHEIMFGRWQETLMLEELCVFLYLRDYIADILSLIFAIFDFEKDL